MQKGTVVRVIKKDSSRFNQIGVVVERNYHYFRENYDIRFDDRVETLGVDNITSHISEIYIHEGYIGTVVGNTFIRNLTKSEIPVNISEISPYSFTIGECVMFMKNGSGRLGIIHAIDNKAQILSVSLRDCLPFENTIYRLEMRNVMLTKDSLNVKDHTSCYELFIKKDSNIETKRFESKDEMSLFVSKMEVNDFIEVWYRKATYTYGPKVEVKKIVRFEV